MIPLQGYVAYKALGSVEATADCQSAAAYDQLTNLGKQITATTTPEGLQGALEGMPQPRIEPEELLAGFDQEPTTLRTRKRTQLLSVRWVAANESIGNILAAPVLARVLSYCRLRASSLRLRLPQSGRRPPRT